MLIYTHNLAEKLFGFAQSREFLKYNTDLCGVLEDPNLQLDIDLAIDLHKADRGDEEAARRLTNTLILSSAFIDMSTKNFYKFKMSTRPVFRAHIARINTTFKAIKMGDTTTLNSIKTSGDDEDGFLDKLLDALKDCLNSPCNLFAQSSDSVASLAKTANAQNINTIPTFSEIKDQFTNAFEGVEQTLFKKLPETIKENSIQLGQLCQKAWGQSMEMFFEKDKDARKKIIEKAQSGDALDVEDEGFRYVPDLDNYLNTKKMSANILSQVASDLGGCFDGFQNSYRNDPYSKDYNLSTTSNKATENKVNNQKIKQTLLGEVTPNTSQQNQDAKANDLPKENCEEADNNETTTSTTSNIALASGSVNPKEVYDYLIQKGLTENQALGMMANIYGESGFQQGLTEKGGTGIGLFQYTYPSRKSAFLEAVPDWQTNWKGQIDYAVDSDPETKRYLSNSFSSPEAAAQTFMTDWERPAESVRPGRTVKHNNFIKDFKSNN